MRYFFCQGVRSGSKSGQIGGAEEGDRGGGSNLRRGQVRCGQWGRREKDGARV